MENYTFTVSEGNKGVRLDIYLAKNFPKIISRTYLQKLIRESKVLVNGRARKSNYKIEVGDFIEVEIPKPQKLELKAENIPISIIFEDDRLIVVDKPAGIVTHPAPGNYSGTLVNALLYHVEKLSESNDGRPGIVHRLDKNTSGVLIVAKDELAHAFLSKQFNKRATDKHYLAVTEGVVQLDNGIIEHPIGRHVRDRKKMAVRFSEGKDAITRYKVLERFEDSTLLEIKPETGRTHQIRVHLAYIGHPVVGDVTYGAKKKNMPIARHALHASRISFLHPTTRERVEFESPLPKDMEGLIAGLKNKS